MSAALASQQAPPMIEPSTGTGVLSGASIAGKLADRRRSPSAVPRRERRTQKARIAQGSQVAHRPVKPS